MIELTCKEVVELVSDYLGRALEPSQRALLEQHVFTCPPCTTYLGQMKTVIALAATLDQDCPPLDHAPAIELFRRWKQRSR